MAKQMNARIAFKNDTQENWNKAINFIPMFGEPILINDEAFPLAFGDGATSADKLTPLLVYASTEEISSLFI